METTPLRRISDVIKIVREECVESCHTAAGAIRFEFGSLNLAIQNQPQKLILSFIQSNCKVGMSTQSFDSQHNQKTCVSGAVLETMDSRDLRHMFELLVEFEQDGDTDLIGSFRVN